MKYVYVLQALISPGEPDGTYQNSLLVYNDKTEGELMLLELNAVISFYWDAVTELKDSNSIEAFQKEIYSSLCQMLKVDKLSWLDYSDVQSLDFDLDELEVR